MRAKLVLFSIEITPRSNNLDLALVIFTHTSLAWPVFQLDSTIHMRVRDPFLERVGRRQMPSSALGLTNIGVLFGGFH